MKKVIALVLAVALSLSMASVAFAAKSAQDFEDAAASAKAITPGTKIEFVGSDFSNASATSGVVPEVYFTDEYFTITVKYDKGGDLVESVKFDNDGKLVLKLKANSKLETPKIANIDLKELSVKAKKKVDGQFERGTVFTLDTTKYTTALGAKFIGYTPVKVTVGDPVSLKNEESGIYKFEEKASKETYDTSEFTFGTIAYGEMRVYKDDKFFLEYDEDVDLDIVKANPDAEIEFYNLGGSFNASMNFELYADEDKYIYELRDGKLVESTLKWNNDASAWTGKVRTLTTYVVSDIKLVAAATAEETKNPDTGANDVVGVAVALAVVSLVAAGAVSLKK